MSSREGYFAITLENSLGETIDKTGSQSIRNITIKKHQATFTDIVATIPKELVVPVFLALKSIKLVTVTNRA